ncbi:unnamed protein product [Cyprideis torosa]|uniref:Uncharacterized protein n=1 Tax=Cyprideis torosa TaxID=163714 RepID=A0A7R8ZJI9_9CRUS|nr:unnamed protein product [Cyprideis torosa]CAG0888754.1 unnamed protein product [Cyprideis torosa]
MFPGGIYDTKFLAGNSWNLNATFLEYVFRKAQLESRRRRTAREPHIALMFPAYKEGTPFVDYHSCGLKTDFSSSINGKSTPACPAYAAVGNCRRVLDGCPLSHDIDVVFRDEELAAQKKRKRKRDVEAAPSVQVIESASETPPSVDGTHEDHPAVERTRGHRASFDAFMTAFALLGNSSSVADLSKEGANKVYLSGKTFPLLIQQSAYSAVSSGHREAIARIRSADLT